jgi:hypothetical protein
VSVVEVKVKSVHQVACSYGCSSASWGDPGRAERAADNHAAWHRDRGDLVERAPASSPETTPERGEAPTQDKDSPEGHTQS